MGASAGKMAFELDSRPIAELYDVGEKLGSGKFATTFAATRRADNLPVAVKVLEKSHYKFKRRAALQEIEAMASLGEGHPNCVSMVAAFEDGLTISLVEELVPGGELLDRISGNQSFSERSAAGIVHQVLCGVEYLHSVGITHRDLKPSNILFLSNDPSSPDYDRVKICDYGLAHRAKVSGIKALVTSDPMSTMCGSPLYMAPEVAKSVLRCRADEDEVAEAYTNLVDVWACGVLLYVMVSGFQPFTQWVDLVRLELSFDYPEFECVSQGCKGLLARLLCEAGARPSAAKALKDPWLAECGAGESATPLASTRTLKSSRGIKGIKGRLRSVFSPTSRRGRHEGGGASQFGSSMSSLFSSFHESTVDRRSYDGAPASPRASSRGTWFSFRGGSGKGRSLADFLSRSSTPRTSPSGRAVQPSPLVGRSRMFSSHDAKVEEGGGGRAKSPRMRFFGRQSASHDETAPWPAAPPAARSIGPVLSCAGGAGGRADRPVSPLPGGGREVRVPRGKASSELQAQDRRLSPFQISPGADPANRLRLSRASFARALSVDAPDRD